MGEWDELNFSELEITETIFWNQNLANPNYSQFQCWKHWSTTGCTKDSCQSDKMNNNGMGFKSKNDVKAPW